MRAQLRSAAQVEDWKYDTIPEIIDGKNIADFVDPDILARLDELEREEEERDADDDGMEVLRRHRLTQLHSAPRRLGLRWSTHSTCHCSARSRPHTDRWAAAAGGGRAARRRGREACRSNQGQKVAAHSQAPRGQNIESHTPNCARTRRAAPTVSRCSEQLALLALWSKSTPLWRLCFALRCLPKTDWRWQLQ